MNNSIEVLDINPIAITYFDKAHENVNISRINHLQNGYYFGPMSHNNIWQNSISKVDY
jgi:hypothetical protein